MKVTDNAGASNSTTQDIVVSANTPPSASFTYSCTNTACSFNSTSTDDGGITGYDWDFGDGTPHLNSPNPSHDYAQRGDYTVTLAVTDVEALSDIVSTIINVKKRGISEGTAGGSQPPPGSGGDSNNMYIWDISMAKKGKSLNVSVFVHQDSNANGVAEASDAPVDSAYIEGWLCPMPSGTCSFVGNQSFTDASGKANWKLLGATASAYSFEVKSMDRSPYTWTPSLDVPPNPSFYP